MSFLEQDRLAGFARRAMDNKFAILWYYYTLMPFQVPVSNLKCPKVVVLAMLSGRKS